MFEARNGALCDQLFGSLVGILHSGVRAFAPHSIWCEDSTAVQGAMRSLRKGRHKCQQCWVLRWRCNQQVWFHMKQEAKFSGRPFERIQAAPPALLIWYVKHRIVNQRLCETSGGESRGASPSETHPWNLESMGFIIDGRKHQLKTCFFGILFVDGILERRKGDGPSWMRHAYAPHAAPAWA